MRIYRIINSIYSKDPFGYNKETSGRWHAVGTPMIYTASSVSLAIVEFLCILGPRVLKTHYSLLIFDADVEMEFDPNDLPRDWDTPFQSDSTQLIGRNWSVHYRSVAMKVPSARIPLYVYENEFNILINPIHPRLKAKVKFIQEKHLNFHLGNWAAEK